MPPPGLYPVENAAEDGPTSRTCVCLTTLGHNMREGVKLGGGNLSGEHKYQLSLMTLLTVMPNSHTARQTRQDGSVCVVSGGVN